MASQQKKVKKLMTGKVISDKMDKTIVVATDQFYKDARFHKYAKRTKKYVVHDAQSQAKAGDIVEFYEGRPLSKTKCMYLEKIIKPAV
jgi:small subunit ribosomal protein S17